MLGYIVIQIGLEWPTETFDFTMKYRFLLVSLITETAQLYTKNSSIFKSIEKD